MSTPYAIGIDLGAHSSSVAVLRPGDAAPQLIGSAVPSVVAFRTIEDEEGVARDEILVGEAARRQAAANPLNTIFDAKSRLGLHFDPESSVTVVHGKVKKKLHRINVLALIIEKLKKEAEAFLGGTVKNAIITVPSSCSGAERAAVRDAASLCDLNVWRCMGAAEATAVALYGVGALGDMENETHMVVADVGAATTSAALITFEDDVIEVY